MLIRFPLVSRSTFVTHMLSKPICSHVNRQFFYRHICEGAVRTVMLYGSSIFKCALKNHTIVTTRWAHFTHQKCTPSTYVLYHSSSSTLKSTYYATYMDDFREGVQCNMQYAHIHHSGHNICHLQDHAELFCHRHQEEEEEHSQLQNSQLWKSRVVK